jgi:hypothetical protein
MQIIEYLGNDFLQKKEAFWNESWSSVLSAASRALLGHQTGAYY